MIQMAHDSVSIELGGANKIDGVLTDR